MYSRKLDVTTSNPHPEVSGMRKLFDDHVSDCESCVQGAMCHDSEAIWRVLCLRALHFHGKAAGDASV